MAEKYKSKLVDTRLTDKWGEIQHNIDGYTPPKTGYQNKVYKSKSLPKAPDYTPDDYDYDFLKDAVAVKDLVISQQNKQATNAAGHTAFPTIGYDELSRYVYPIQRHLIEIGYLDKGDDNGILGPRTEGAIKRYEYNKPGQIEEIWHGIKKMDFNPFD